MYNILSNLYYIFISIVFCYVILNIHYYKSTTIIFIFTHDDFIAFDKIVILSLK